MGLHAAVVLCAVWHTRAHLSRRPSDGASTYITSVSTKRSVSPPPPLPPPESAQITGMQNVRRREDNMGEKRAGRGTKKRKRPLAYTDSHTAQGDRHTRHTDTGDRQRQTREDGSDTQNITHNAQSNRRTKTQVQTHRREQRMQPNSWRTHTRNTAHAHLDRYHLRQPLHGKHSTSPRRHAPAHEVVRACSGARA